MGLFDLLQGKARGYGNLRWTINTTGEWIYPDAKYDSYINDGYKALPNVYSIISMILSKTTIVPFEVYKVKNKTKERQYKAMMHDTKNVVKAMKLKNEAYDKVENSDLEKLLLNPNNYQTLNDLNWSLDGYKMLTGNSYAYLIKVGSTSELHAIPSPFVDIKVKGSPFDPILKYNITYLESEIDGEEMLHFKYWNPIASHEAPANSFKGQSPLQSCRMLLGRYKDADITQGFMFKNMGPNGMITGKTNTADGLTEAQAISIQDKFKQQHTGTYKAGEIMVTPSALDWVSFGLSPVDLNILQSKREALSELCNAYNVPIGLFSDTNSTENNMIESRKSMITDAVIPIVEARKMVLNKFLVPKFGEDLVIEYDYSVFHELQDDIEKQANAAVKMYWISPNEKRSMTGYDQDPDPNMNKYYFPTGLETLDNINTDMGQIDEAFLNEEV